MLLGTGASNDEIGHRLYISPKTASVHVTHICRKPHRQLRAGDDLVEDLLLEGARFRSWWRHTSTPRLNGPFKN